MSTFMVADDTINSIVSWLEREITRSLWLREQLNTYAAATGLSFIEWQADLAQRMFQLNIAGVDARYGKGETARLGELYFTYAPVSPPSDIQALKSINCWL